jgi:hypothetical protein
MRYLIGAVAMGLALAVSACGARGQTHVGVGMDRDGLSHFEMAVGDYYGVPVGAVPGYIHPDELPVVYLLAREAGVSPDVVIALREQGWSWMDITYHLGVDPYLYVRRLPRQRGYWGYPGRYYGYLTDRHIIDYVNLVFWADYHRRPVTQIIVIRQRVPTWAFYVRYHAPRVVFVHTPRRHDPPPPRRGGSGRLDEPRRAVPRDTGERARPATTQQARIVERPTPVTRAAAQPVGRTVERTPAAQPTRPVTQPTRPAAQPSRPVQARPTPQPSRPAAQPTRPAAQSSRPAARPSRPAPQPSRPAATRPSSSSRGEASSATRSAPRSDSRRSPRGD